MADSATVPAWLHLPLPANAVSDPALLAEVTQLCAKLPDTFRELESTLHEIRALATYEPTVNTANALVWAQLETLLSHKSTAARRGLVRYACANFTERGVARVLRRLSTDPDVSVRRSARKATRKKQIAEVALPREIDGDWNTTGWFLDPTAKKITRHKTGIRVIERAGLPVIRTLAELRKLLNIQSSRQLGFFLLASDENNGPYTTHTIPKRDGSERQICAPKKQLKWVQKQILKQILSKVPTHVAAHGFVPGRSTVSNATPHVGAELLVKFDLKDFFPTIHYFRVMGLFASLGYPLGNCMFGNKDESNQIAPVLARLCCYTPKPQQWNTAVLPQGAPTSPAISNLMCRRLDARLAGLAARNNGTYTRYADDLTFSFSKVEGVNLGRLRWWVDQVCQQEGFVVNQPKYRVIRGSQRQVVTGLVVNDHLRAPRELRRELRAILHNCEKHGIASQAARHPDYAGNVGAFCQYLRGIAAYLNMIQPEDGEQWLARVNAILGESDGDA